MGEIANLNKARKARAKSQSKLQAEANRAKFGRSKPEKELDAARAQKAGALLDAHKRER